MFYFTSAALIGSVCLWALKTSGAQSTWTPATAHTSASTPMFGQYRNPGAPPDPNDSHDSTPPHPPPTHIHRQLAHMHDPPPACGQCLCQGCIIYARNWIKDLSQRWRRGWDWTDFSAHRQSLHADYQITSQGHRGRELLNRTLSSTQGLMI